MSALSSWARLLIWDYGRGSLAYDLLCLFVILLFVLAPPGLWGDPLSGRR